MTTPDDPGQLVLRFDVLEDIDNQVRKMLESKAAWRIKAAKAKAAEDALHETQEWQDAGDTRREAMDARNAYEEHRKDLVDGCVHRVSEPATVASNGAS